MARHRLFQDDLPSVSISPMRSSGLVTLDTEWVVIAFGEGGSSLKRKIRLTRHKFRNGGSWSFFVCPDCGRPARILKASRKTHVSALLSSRRDWISRIERLAGRARRCAGGAAQEVARAARRRSSEIASEARPQVGPPMVAHGFVAKGDDPRAPGSAATAS